MKHIVRDLVILSAMALVAASELVGQPVTQRKIAGGKFEASAVVSVPGTSGALFVDDGRTKQIFWMEFAPDGTQKGAAVAVPLPTVDVTDLEGLTSDGQYFYAVGSQSKTVGFDGDGLIRFTFDPATKQVRNVESIRALKRFLATNVAELKGTEHQVGDAVLNIEALAWDQRESRLLLGLRAPVAGGDALVVPLKLRNANGPFTADNLVVDGKGALRLPLGGAGLRSLEFDPVSGKFVLFAGAALNDENVDFRFLEWDGQAGAAAPRELGRYSRKLKPEGITRMRLDGRDAMVVVFDVGSYEVIRAN
jgi:hypothetical protein